MSKKFIWLLDSGSAVNYMSMKFTAEPAVRGGGGWGEEVYLYSFLTTTLEGVRGQRHAPAALYPRERPSTHC